MNNSSKDTTKIISKLTKENERMKKAINNFCKIHKIFHASWLRRSEIKELFDIIKSYEGGK